MEILRRCEAGRSPYQSEDGSWPAQTVHAMKRMIIDGKVALQVPSETGPGWARFLATKCLRRDPESRGTALELLFLVPGGEASVLECASIFRLHFSIPN